MARHQGEAILFELLRSFTTLARTLNLSKSVRELGTTRQTVRRHIDLLEDSMGIKLFDVEDRQYQLTDDGKHALPEARELIARGAAWMKRETGHKSGLFHVTIEREDGFSYYIQQHPLSALWSSSSPLLQQCFLAWAESRGEIEHEAFRPYRPFGMVFRPRETEWICVEVGNKSSFATWVGWEWERSSIGRGLHDLPSGDGFATLTMLPFKDVYITEGARLEHIHTQIARGGDPTRIPISYHRLLLGCRFPDDSFAMVSIIDRTHNLEISGLSDEKIRTMPAEYIMNIEINSLKKGSNSPD